MMNSLPDSVRFSGETGDAATGVKWRQITLLLDPTHCATNM